MSRLGNSWNIFKKTSEVIQKEKKLLIFPLIYGIVLFFLISLIFGVSIFMPHPDPAAAEETGNAYTLLEFFSAYFLLMLAGNLCSTAFYSEIMNGLRGESVSISRGFGTALSRFSALVFWTLLSSTVGVILHILESRKSGVVASFILKMAGMAWAVSSCFVIPVIVSDKTILSPFKVLNRSISILKGTWGESLIGYAGMGALSFLVSVLGIPLIAVCVFYGFIHVGTSTAYFAFTAAAALTFALLIFYYILGAAKEVYMAALYLYAENGRSTIFTTEEMAHAFYAAKNK